MVPSLLDICALAGGRDATAEPEDEDVLFGRDGAKPDLEADDDDDDDDNLAESWTVVRGASAGSASRCGPHRPRRCARSGWAL